MKKHVHKLHVVDNQKLTDTSFLLKLTHEQALPPMLPAQFVEIKVEDAPHTFLRRPISIHDVNTDKNELHLLIEIKGQGTRKLSELTPGNRLDTIYPLGNTWTVPADASRVLLIGGGCGVAPLLFTARQFASQGLNVSTLIGGRSKENLLRKEAYEAFGKVYTCTEDGSHGEKGLVTEHSVISRLSDFDAVYTCGPEAMMKAVASLAQKNDVLCQVSLENTMACGIGACLVCVQETKNGNKCVCTDGPVFNVNDLLW
ncbi:MAG: dihydroorotate dehydrogenase electron transfer subunit [Bacteroidales bacterium]